MKLDEWVLEIEKADTELYGKGYIDKTDRLNVLQMAVTLKAAEMGVELEKRKRNISKQ